MKKTITVTITYEADKIAVVIEKPSDSPTCVHIFTESESKENDNLCASLGLTEALQLASILYTAKEEGAI